MSDLGKPNRFLKMAVAGLFLALLSACSQSGEARLSSLAPVQSPGGSESGPTLYSKNCQACHGENGEGRINLAPALTGLMSRLHQADGGPPYLAHFLLWGSRGEVTIDGAPYRGSHPPFERLSDSEISALLNFLLAGFDGSEGPAGEGSYLPGDVAEYRAQKKQPEDVRSLRPGVD